MVAAYAPRAAAHYPAELKDPNGHWTASNLYYLTVAANTGSFVKGARGATEQCGSHRPGW